MNSDRNTSSRHWFSLEIVCRECGFTDKLAFAEGQQWLDIPMHWHSDPSPEPIGQRCSACVSKSE